MPVINARIPASPYDPTQTDLPTKFKGVSPFPATHPENRGRPPSNLPPPIVERHSYLELPRRQPPADHPTQRTVGSLNMAQAPLHPRRRLPTAELAPVKLQTAPHFSSAR